MVLSGNTSVSNFSASSSFRIRKSIGRDYSSRSSQVFGSPSSSHPHSPTFLVFVPLPGYSYTHSPSFHLPSWHLTAPFSAIDLRSLYKNPPRLRPSSWPSLMPFWHPPRTPQQSLFHPFSHPTIGHRFVPRHRSGVQVHTLTSWLRLIHVTYQM